MQGKEQLDEVPEYPLIPMANAPQWIQDSFDQQTKVWRKNRG
jgi:hypothetical protein